MLHASQRLHLGWSAFRRQIGSNKDVADHVSNKVVIVASALDKFPFITKQILPHAERRLFVNFTTEKALLKGQRHYLLFP